MEAPCWNAYPQDSILYQDSWGQYPPNSLRRTGERPQKFEVLIQTCRLYIVETLLTMLTMFTLFETLQCFTIVKFFDSKISPLFELNVRVR